MPLTNQSEVCRLRNRRSTSIENNNVCHQRKIIENNIACAYSCSFPFSRSPIPSALFALSIQRNSVAACVQHRNFRQNLVPSIRSAFRGAPITYTRVKKIIKMTVSKKWSAELFSKLSGLEKPQMYLANAFVDTSGDGDDKKSLCFSGNPAAVWNMCNV